MISNSSILRRCLLSAVGVVLVGGVGVAIWKWNDTSSSHGVSNPPSFAQTYPGLDLKDPTPSYESLRYVAETGGDENTRQAAIIWLDQEARRSLTLAPEREAWLFSLLEKNGHVSWDEEYRLWLFNSAFNLLHHGLDQARLSRLLQQLALHDSQTTMRLYALQHIGTQRAGERINGELADEIQAALRQLVEEPEGKVAGTAIALLTEWNGQNHATDPEILTRAVEMAADESRPVDVRITSLHTAQASALPLARQLAIDPAKSVILRKAAIATIGRYGSEADYADLKKLSAESSRLAQAAEPAMQLLSSRPEPKLTPYR